jgi:TrmH family RNA methyltransferase
VLLTCVADAQPTGFTASRAVCYAPCMPHAHRDSSSKAGASSGARNTQLERVTGKDNPWLKRFRAGFAGHTEKDGSAISIEGARLVEEALRSAIPVDAILVSETGRKHLAQIGAMLAQSVRLLATSDKIFQGLADTDTPQGIAALVRPRRTSFDDLMRGPGAPLIVVLVGIQDPGNVGAILRTAEALGASGVAACKADSLGTAHVFSPKVIRASAGAAFRFPVAEGISLPILQAQLRVAGVRVIAATSHDPRTPAPSPWQADLRGPVALLIGNEGAGLPAEVERSADARVRIPLSEPHGIRGAVVESLNAATAAAVLLYEAARQRAEVDEHVSDDNGGDLGGEAGGGS